MSGARPGPPHALGDLSTPLERIGWLLWALRDLPLPVDAIVLTPQEFASRCQLSFLRGVMKEAKLIYERGETAV